MNFLLLNPATLPIALATGIASGLVTRTSGGVIDVVDDFLIEPIAGYFSGNSQEQQNAENAARLKTVAAGVALAAIGIFIFKKVAK